MHTIDCTGKKKIATTAVLARRHLRYYLIDSKAAQDAGRPISPLKNAIVALFNLAKCGAKLRTARKITT